MLRWSARNARIGRRVSVRDNSKGWHAGTSEQFGLLRTGGEVELVSRS